MGQIFFCNYIKSVPDNESIIAKSKSTRGTTSLNGGPSLFCVCKKNLTNIVFTTAIFQYGH